MESSVFREYDIRGIVGQELHLNQVYDCTRAIAYYFLQKQPETRTVAVGMDGRIHSAAMKEEICRALLDSGIDVLFIGVCPSPVLYFALYQLPVHAGLMITASHNGAAYNGIKICLGTKSLWGPQIREICDLFRSRRCVRAERRGVYHERAVIPEYISWLADHFPDLSNMSLRVAIDCGNGAAGTVLPQLIDRMGWKQVDLLYPEVDGTYPHHEADPVVEENMLDLKKKMRAGLYDLGIGLDGDVDRMAAMTPAGRLLLGDMLLALFAQSVLQKHPGASVVSEVKMSHQLMKLVRSWGGKSLMSATGHAIIKNKMSEHHALLGGELSCHFFFKDRYFGYDDGIYAMMRLFELVIRSGKTIEECIAIFPDICASPEYRVPCEPAQKQRAIDGVKEAFAHRADAQLITIDGVRVELPYGWGLVRASNTQSVLSIRFEADTHDELVRVKREFIEALSSIYAASELENVFQLRDNA